MNNRVNYTLVGLLVLFGLSLMVGFGYWLLKPSQELEMKKYVIKKSQLQAVIELYRNEVAGLEEQRKQIEKSIEIVELPEYEK